MKIISGEKGKFFFNCFLSILSGICGPLMLFATAYFIDAINKIDQTASLFQQMLVPGLVLILAYTLPLVEVYRDYLNKKLAHPLDIKWQTEVVGIIEHIPYSAYEDEEIYDELKQIHDHNLYKNIVNSVQMTISTLISIVLFSVLLGISSWLLLIIIVLVTPAISFFIAKLANLDYKAIYKTNLPRRKAIYKSSILRNYAYAKEVRIHDSAGYMIADWEAEQKAVDRKTLKNKLRVGLLKKMITNSDYLLIFVNLAITLYLYIAGQITLGLFIGISTQIFNMKFMSKVTELITLQQNIKLLKKSYAQLQARCSFPPLSAAPVLDDVTIEFVDVSFKYPKAEDFTLKNVSFKCSPRESIAIVGENGAGKSTLIKLMLGLYAPTSGEILLNGVNINRYSLADKAKLFGVAFQDYGKYSLSI